MKVKKTLILFSVATLLLSIFPMSSHADSVEDLKKQETQAVEEAEQIDSEINSVVAEVNEKYAELAELEKKMTDSEATIVATEAEMKEINENIDKRKDAAAERLQELQLNGSSTTSFQAILESENFSDLITRVYAVKLIQNAENDKVVSLYADQERLEELEKTLSETQAGMEEQQVAIETEKTALNNQVADLQVKYSANETALHDLTAKRVEKEEADRAEKERAEAAKVVAVSVETPKQDTTNSSQSNNDNTNNGNSGGNNVTPPTPAPPAVQPPVSGGGSIAGQATAYVATGNKTATGTVPTPFRTIAVDPNVIPLGSLVQIDVPSLPQYNGVYVAEDTGGAVKGNIIDIFVGSGKEATNFGRRTINFTVL